MPPDPVAQFLGTWGYPAYVAAFIATAFGSPVTEDLLLLTGGYLVGTGVFSWRVAGPLSVVCVVVSDSIVYWFGRLLRTRALKRDSWFRLVLRPAQLRLATRWFSRFGERVVFFARLIPGTRLLVFVTAGVRGMPLWRFALIDAAATAIYVPVLMLAGATLGERIGSVDQALQWVADRAVFAMAAVAGLVVLRVAWRRWTQRVAERAMGR
jgi:membrane protein DedA with SNARE-associated domain